MNINSKTTVSVALIASLCSGLAWATDKYERVTERLTRTEEAVEWIKVHESEQTKDIKLLLSKLDENNSDTIQNKANIESMKKVIDKWERQNWN